MKKFRITIKEFGNPEPLRPSYEGDVDKKFLIDFFGLENPDVEWYKIDEVLTCCICGREMSYKNSHSPYPVCDEGRCCTECNYKIVLPKRMSL